MVKLQAVTADPSHDMSEGSGALDILLTVLKGLAFFPFSKGQILSVPFLGP